MRNHSSKFICASFDSNQNASQAIKKIRNLGIPKRKIHLFEKPYEFTKDGQDSMISNPTRGILTSAGIAAVGGAIIGGLAAVVFDIFLNPWLAALVGALGGAAFGALGGLLVGTDVPSKQIQKMAEALEEGKKLLVVEIEKRRTADLDSALTVMRNSGGLNQAII